MRLSVRLRLTIVVCAIAGVFMMIAATIAPSRVEDALIDDAVESETQLLAGTLWSTRLPFEDLGGTALGDVVFMDPAELAFFVDQLEARGRLDDLIRASGSDELIVAAGNDEFARISPGLNIESFSAPLDSIDQPVIAFFDLASTAFGDRASVVVGSDGGLIADQTSDETLFRVVDIDGVEVIAVVPIAGVDATVAQVRRTMWIGVPGLMLLSGLLTWLLAGRALKPVRMITERTAAISSGNLGERIPIPSSGDEIATLATTMNSMLERIESDDRRRRRFVSDASHELRSPVAILRSEAEVALRDPDRVDVANLAGGVLGESIRMGAIIDDLLALARHDEGLPSPTSSIDLDEIVLAEAGRARRVPVDVAKVSAGRVMGRADEFSRVVSHLLDNGARHASSRLAIELVTAGDRVILVVEDDGPGVPDDERDAIFERFTRLDEARARDHGGAGLGLSVVAGVVQRSGGSVRVDGGALGGARFIVDLPAA